MHLLYSSTTTTAVVQDGDTAYLTAAREGAEDSLRLLMANKADIFAVNEVP